MAINLAIPGGSFQRSNRIDDAMLVSARDDCSHATPAAPIDRRASLALTGSAAMPASHPSLAEETWAPPALTEIASTSRSWVHVACAANGRLFVNHSRWFGPLDLAVGEVRDGRPVPYPDVAFNAGDGSGLLGGDRAVAVQSVRMDPDGRTLWIVDTGNPQLSGPVPSGAKLVRVDTATNRVVGTVPLGANVAPSGSYLADLQIDAERQVAFLPDLALGAIAVLDLRSGRGHRVLEGHPSTRAEPIDLLFGGRPWKMPDGSRPRTAATSVALDATCTTLYFKPLVGRHLYQVPIAALLAGPEQAAAAVRTAVVAHPSDAITFGPDGFLYMTAIDRNAITRWRPGAAEVATVVSDQRLAWPVGLRFGPDGAAYTTVGRINEGVKPTDRYRLYRFSPT